MTEPTTPELRDDFRGDTPHLIDSINALLKMDAAGVLRPNGVGGHARTLLASAANRLAAAQTVRGVELSDAQNLRDTISAIFDAVGYAAEYARQWPKEKASITFKRWFDEQLAAASAPRPMAAPMDPQP